MKNKLCLFFLLVLCSTACFAVKPRPLVYKGDTLPQSDMFTKRQLGSVKQSAGLPEISGIACSRVTPGYLWMQSDDYESVIVATDERAQKRCKTVSFKKKIRWDWEDMSGGVYEGKNYLFIGAFGDNDETDGEYYIVYLEEPEISEESPTISIEPTYIKFQYPEGKLHNAEALMYDNKEQMIYIITKVYYDVCQVFSLPFRLDYGEEMQTLSYVCDLGVKSDLGDGSKPFKGFHLVTAADISPDGKYILIKNHNNIQAIFSWVLLWTREGDESVSETLKNRQPVVISCYEYEWQGEAICWLDSTTFYTTSDSDGEPPIFKYTRRKTEDIESVPFGSNGTGNRLVLIDNVLYVRNKEGLYTLDGRKISE